MNDPYQRQARHRPAADRIAVPRHAGQVSKTDGPLPEVRPQRCATRGLLPRRRRSTEACNDDRAHQTVGIECPDSSDAGGGGLYSGACPEDALLIVCRRSRARVNPFAQALYRRPIRLCLASSQQDVPLPFRRRSRPASFANPSGVIWEFRASEATSSTSFSSRSIRSPSWEPRGRAAG